MNLNKIILLAGLLGLIAVACEVEEEPEYVYPLEYLPAYPGSYWDYSNGERVLTSSTYVLHSYQASVESSEETEKKYVPEYNGQYLYEYSITQNSTSYPIKQLLDETTGSAWLVNIVNGESVMRQVTDSIDSLYLSIPVNSVSVDSLFEHVVVVVEFLKSLGVDNWNTKEYYAKNIGLIRVEVNDPYDEQDPVVQKEIRGYYIAQ